MTKKEKNILVVESSEIIFILSKLYRFENETATFFSMSDLGKHAWV